jgi:PAS domain S-box-containing protein
MIARAGRATYSWMLAAGLVGAAVIGALVPWGVRASEASGVRRISFESQQHAETIATRLRDKIETASSVSGLFTVGPPASELTFAEHCRALLERHEAITLVRYAELRPASEIQRIASDLRDAGYIRTLIEASPPLLIDRPTGMVAVAERIHPRRPDTAGFLGDSIASSPPELAAARRALASTTPCLTTLPDGTIMVVHAVRPGPSATESPVLGLIRIDVDPARMLSSGPERMRLEPIDRGDEAASRSGSGPSIMPGPRGRFDVRVPVLVPGSDRDFMLSYPDRIEAGERDLLLPALALLAVGLGASVIGLGGAWLTESVRRRRDEQIRLTALVDERTKALDARNRELEEATAALELQQRALDASTIVAVTDARGVITHVNRKFEEISGYSCEELVGCTHAVVNAGVHPKSFFAEMYREIHAGNLWRGEICNRRKDGRLYWVDTVIVPRLGADGRPEAFTAMRFDITERKQAEKDLVATRDHLDLIIDASRTGTWDFNTLTGVIKANDAFFTMLGETPPQCGEIDSSWLWDRIHPDDIETVYAANVSARNVGDGRYSCEFRMRAASGEYRWLLSHGRVIDRRADGETVRIAGVHMDIDSQKRVQEELDRARVEAEAATKAKSDFLANMSHEIRTPMTAIIGYAELLDLQADGPDAAARRRDAVATIVRNGEHLLEIINDILDLSKIEAGKLDVERLPVDLGQVVREVRSLMDVRAKGKGISLDIEVDGEIPARIRTDPLRMRQILTNLLGNAIKFTETGGVRIRVACDRSPKPLIRLSIEDSGIGMTPEQMDRLFKPFSQADESTTRTHGGTGLGLAISLRLAELLGGEITVESTPGTGSVFTATLDPGPLEGVEWITEIAAGPGDTADAADAADAADHSATAPKARKTPLADRRILLVEDGPDNRKLIGFHLRRAGATVVEAEHGGFGVERATAAAEAGEPFDVVLMDMQMPVMDGYTAATTLREAGSELPIVALTAHAMSGDRERCLAAGCDEYLTKPVDRTKLIELCARLAASGRPAARTDASRQPRNDDGMPWRNAA